MSLKLSIFLPGESIENIESLQEFISDLGDNLVLHGFGNEILTEKIDDSYIEKLSSYIIIASSEDDELENLENSFLVIPI